MSHCPAAYLEFADQLANLAGGMLRDFSRGDLEVEMKPDGSPVTAADRMVERALRQEIAARFPDHGVIGEEFPATRADAEWLGIIGPLDGSKEFIQGLPLFGVLIGLAHHGRLVLGLALQKLTGDRWLRASGHGTRFNGQPVRVRLCPRLEHAVVSVMGYDSFCAAHHERLDRIRERVRSIVIADSFYVFGLLANGRVDLIVSNRFALHDYAALEVSVTRGRRGPLGVVAQIRPGDFLRAAAAAVVHLLVTEPRSASPHPRRRV